MKTGQARGPNNGSLRLSPGLGWRWAERFAASLKFVKVLR